MYQVRALGDAKVEIGEVVIRPESDVLFALALFLGIEARRPHAREDLCRLLWGKADDTRVRHRLRQTIYRLRAHGAAINDRRSEIRLDPASVRSDLTGIDVAAVRSLATTASASRGELVLPGYTPRLGREWATWLAELRSSAERGIRHAIIVAIAEARTGQRWWEVEQLAHTLLRLDPLSEEGNLAFAEALAWSGSKKQALDVLSQYADQVGGTTRALALPIATLKRRVQLLPEASQWNNGAQTALIGRANTLAVLGSLAAKARSGDVTVAFIQGPPGYGKTRILDETLRSGTLSGMRAIKIDLREGDSKCPLVVFHELIPALLDLPGALGVAPESMVQLRRLSQQNPSGGEMSSPTPSAMAYEDTRRAVRDLVAAVVAENPVFIAVDNIHWIDAQSLRLLGDVFDAAAGGPFFFVCTSRLERFARHLALARVYPATRIALSPLSGSEARALLHQSTTSCPQMMSPDHLTWCEQIAEGNPYHLCELAAHWAKTGKDFSVPESLQLLLDDRLNSLSANAMRLAQKCAVLGRVCTLDRLTRLASTEPQSLMVELEELENAGLLIVRDAGITLKHELMAEAIFARITPICLRALHSATAQLLEGEVGGEPGLVWEAIKHYELACTPERAVTLARRTAEQLVSLGLPEEACEVLEAVVDSRGLTNHRTDLLEAVAIATRAAARWFELSRVATALHERAVQLSPTASPHSMYELLTIEAEWNAGSVSSSLLQRVTPCVIDQTASHAHRVHAAVWALILADNHLDSESARHVYRTIEPFLDDASIDDLSRHRARLVYHESVGSLADATLVIDDIMVAARKRCDVAEFIRVLRLCVYPLRAFNDFDKAFNCLAEARDLSERHNQHIELSRSIALTASTYLLQLDMPAARLWLDRAFSFARVLPDRSRLGDLAGIAVRLPDFRETEAEAFMKSDPIVATANLSRRAREQWLANWILIQRKCNTNVSIDDAVLALSADYEAGKRHTGQDYCVLALASAHRADGRADVSRALVASHLNIFRRERTPVPDALRSVGA
ncbi:MAG: hypothetical protein NVS4B3_13620 [Gemmatimonadaceae bacterium]